MENVKALVEQVANGALTAEEAGPQIKQALVPKEKVSDEDFADSTFRSMEDDSSDIDGTFMQVEAAWIGGRLSDSQFQTIRKHVMS